MRRGILAASSAAPPASSVTWDPAHKGADIVLSGGDLVVRCPFGGWQGVRATVGRSAGKWAFEVTITGAGVLSDTYIVPGVASAAWDPMTYYPGGDTNGVGVNVNSPFFHIFNNGFVLPSTAADWALGDVVTLCYDADTGDLTTKRNGVFVCTKATGFGGVEMFPAVGLYTPSSGCTGNFGPLLYPEPGYSDGWGA